MTTTTTTTATSTTTSARPVTWFEVHTADVARSKRFYGDVFGWGFDDSLPGYTMIELGEGAPIAGGIADSGGRYPANAIFMVQVPDVAAALAAAAAHGGSVVAEAQTTPVGLSFGYAADPDGAVFGVWCPPPQG